MKKLIRKYTNIYKVSESDLIVNNLYESNSENRIIEFIFLNIVYFFIKNKKISDIY